MKQTIIPHLWFDTQAKEAAEFYTSVFPNSKVTNLVQLHDTPSGDSDIVAFELAGQPFMAISAGPYFTINPSISFIVNFDPSIDADARGNLDRLWAQLSDGGKVLMELDAYPFSAHYGWVQDRYGTSWQLILTNPEGEPRPMIVPALMYVGGVAGKAEEAFTFYTSVFAPYGESKAGFVARYSAGMEPDKEGTVMFADFMLLGQWLAAMDSAQQHDFVFNEAVSLMVTCDSQEEIDALWEKLSAVPEAEQCGWLKDRFGVSWQITSARMDEMMEEGTEEQIARVTQAFLPMKKFDVATLERAYRGES